MEGGIDVDAVLDYIVFVISSSENRYEAHICSQGKTEKLASGPFEQLACHLPEAKPFLSNQLSDSFKLQINDRRKNLSWFTKSTLASFLHFVNGPEALEVANSIENEISQLEDTRRFHLTLYTKENGGHSGDGTTDIHNYLQKDQTASSDATKNELLRAMDSRLLALEEEFVATFNRAAGATCSARQISDLAAFAEHFGATNLRNSLLKYLSIGMEDKPADPAVQESTSSYDPRGIHEDDTEEILEPSSQNDKVKPVENNISPAKIAQAERQSSTESEESSDSSDVDCSFAERSQPLIRSETPRRSASPMRRVQIGRSGSRRSTALTIKSLNYCPARERISSNKDAEGDNSRDKESDQPPKKPENTVRQMSVQDAINLFESKQNDRDLDIQKRRASEVSSSTSKSVLRRWSAGTSESFTHHLQENSSDTSSHNASNTVVPEAEKKSTDLKAESDNIKEVPIQDESAQEVVSLGREKVMSPPVDNPADLNIPEVEEIKDRAVASAEWHQQKEAELNQMLMKMMESKPGKYQGSHPLSDGYQDISIEQQGGFYGQYKEKRDEKLRAENTGKQAAKEAQFEVMQQALEQKKAEMASKRGAVRGKQDPLNSSQRPRRNSSSPVFPKKEASKPFGTKKASPKTSPLPATRSSWSSGTLPRTTGTSQTKTATMISASSTLNRRKSQPAPSPTRLGPRTEGPLQQSKGKKGTVTDVKQSLRGQDSKQQKMVTKSNKTEKTKEPPASEGDSALPSAKAKPSFYNKVTKKSSIVPLESKPFLKKGTGIGPGVGPVVARTKVPQCDELSKTNENLIQAEEKECSTVVAEVTTKVEGDGLVQETNNVDANLDSQNGDDMNVVQTNNSDQSPEVVDNAMKNQIEIPVPEIQPDADLVISSAAWVEAETQGVPISYENGLPETPLSPGLMPVASSSPHVRHSLSQMLQADSCEPEIIEWGNAENPPALIYQKDAPKGLKRLLKFARKSKGDANVTGWASPSVVSEGEDDQEEPKVASKRTSDALLRKATLQAKGHGKHNNMLDEGFDGRNSHKRETNDPEMPHSFSAQSSMTSVTALSSVKSQEGFASDTASTKATRSFFSLSTFRSSKSSETKLR